jgi:hypothetical protein
MSMQAALDEIAINDIAWNLRLYQYDTHESGHDLTEALMSAGRKHGPYASAATVAEVFSFLRSTHGPEEKLCRILEARHFRDHVAAFAHELLTVHNLHKPRMVARPGRA